MKHVVLWDDGNDKDFSQVCPDDELDLFLKELPDLYNGAKNIRVYIVEKNKIELVAIRALPEVATPKINIKKACHTCNSLIYFNSIKKNVPLCSLKEKRMKDLYSSCSDWRPNSDVRLITTIEADRDQWKARAEAMEKAIKELRGINSEYTNSMCYTCVSFKNHYKNGSNGNCNWQFDEARFAEKTDNE